jgi:hypothetical protein
MMKKVIGLIVLALLLVGAVTVLASSGISDRGVQGVTYPGNFVSSDDDQVCYDMATLGYIGEVTTEMRGFKIDPPADYDDGFVNVILSADGRNLSWSSTNATLLAFIVKGGPNYNVYNYVGTGFDEDSGLHSPSNKKGTPQISHYNVCYFPEPPSAGDQGCTPGYWRNHTDRWQGAAPSDHFHHTFGAGPHIMLGDAIELGGGGVNALVRHATAALLNAHGGVPNADGTTVDYPFTADEVTAMVQAAFADGGDIEGTKNTLAAANELGCPLSGTPAN